MYMHIIAFRKHLHINNYFNLMFICYAFRWRQPSPRRHPTDPSDAFNFNTNPAGILYQADYGLISFEYRISISVKSQTWAMFLFERHRDQSMASRSNSFTASLTHTPWCWHFWGPFVHILMTTESFSNYSKQIHQHW